MVRRKDRTTVPPSILPGYSDLIEIGGGVFATVYRATELETGRNVALKILKPDVVYPHLIDVFRHEVEALGQVSDHPNIVTLYRPSSTPDGRPALVLELCRESLAHQLRANGPLDTRDVVRTGIKIAGALETAHRQLFLHLDIKPQNILVTQFGELALADFGIAALQASAQATAGLFGVTTLHAAPEILEGHALSPATDVYGLASTMCQLLTDRAPFAAFENEALASVILRILRDPARPLRAENIPIELSDLLERGLQKVSGRRPASAASFADALQAIEIREGWPPTSYVTWDTGSGRHPAAVTVTHVSAGAPPTVPAPAPATHSTEPDRTAPLPSLLLPDAAPSAPSGPSRNAPVPPDRNVVRPDPAPRRSPGRPIERPPLPPLLPAGLDSEASGTNPGPARPVFLDPDRAASGASGRRGHPEASPREPAYRERLVAPPGVRPRGGSLSPIAMAAVLAALAVLVAAVLLAVGLL